MEATRRAVPSANDFDIALGVPEQLRATLPLHADCLRNDIHEVDESEVSAFAIAKDLIKKRVGAALAPGSTATALARPQRALS